MYHTLNDAIQSIFGAHVIITAKRTVHGGDCNDAFRLELNNGAHVFMKANAVQNAHFFRAEEQGLSALRKANVIAVPEVLGRGTDEENGFSFLLMKWIDEGTRTKHFWEDFGRKLALLHEADANDLVPGGPFGFPEDNVIGFRPQINTPHEAFIPFYRDCRLAPQIKDAAEAGYLDTNDRKRAEKILERLDDYLIEPKHPSLLHGDLWAGNFMTGEDGHAVLIDPAAYVGHPEADIAMTELFGGFPEAFYAAYRETAPLQGGYEDRRDLYHLYQMLNHLNQFGTSYLGSVRRLLNRYQ